MKKMQISLLKKRTRPARSRCFSVSRSSSELIDDREEEWDRPTARKCVEMQKQSEQLFDNARLKEECRPQPTNRVSVSI